MKFLISKIKYFSKFLKNNFFIYIIKKLKLKQQIV
jgi:hypothetical protein